MNDETAPAQPFRKRTAPSLASTVVVLLGLSLVLAACGTTTQPGTSAAQQLAFGVEMAERGLWGEALFRFQQAERISPGDPQVLNNLAVAYEATGQFERALEIYRNAIERAGNDTTLRQNYSRFSEFYATYRPEEDPEEGAEEEAEESEEEAGAEAGAEIGAETEDQPGDQPADQGGEAQTAPSEGQSRPQDDTSETPEEAGEAASEPSEGPEEEPVEDPDGGNR